MLIASILTLVSILIGYQANRVAIFSLPISMLYDRPYWIFYNISLLMFTVLLVLHLVRSWRGRITVPVVVVLT
jgi:hypothetical protein